MAPTEFTVTEDHIRLLGRAYIDWVDYAYEGAPGFGCKRPFGDSNVWRDIYEITHPEKTDDEVNDLCEDDEFCDSIYETGKKIFREMEYVLQICTFLAGRGELITPGEYSRPERYDTRTWVRADG